MKDTLQNVLIRVARFCFGVYRKIFKPVTLGVRCIAVDQRERLLLVRHRGTDQWFLPGGGVKKNETLPQAAARELQEETGITVAPPLLRLFGCYLSTKEGRRDCIIVYTVALEESSFQHKTCFEIDQMAFFADDQLPETTSLGTRKRINEYLKKQPLAERW